MGCSKSSLKREVYSNKSYLKKRKTSNFTPKATGKRGRKKTEKLVEGKK